MITETLKSLFSRDLSKLKSEIELYRNAPRAAYRNQPFQVHVRLENKRRWWPLAVSKQVLAFHRTVKHALDPRGILNPGKFLG